MTHDEDPIDFLDDVLDITLESKDRIGPVDHSSDTSRAVRVRIGGNRWNPEAPTTPVQFVLVVSQSVRRLSVDVEAGSQAVLQIVDAHEELYVSVTAPGRRSARLTLRETTMRGLTASRCTVEVEKMPTGTGGKRRTIDQVTLFNADLEISGRNISGLHLEDECAFQLTNTPVGQIQLGKSSRFRGRTAGCQVRRIALDAQTPNPRAAPDVILLPGSELHVDVMERVRAVLSHGATLFLGSGTDLVLNGPGDVHVSKSCERVTFQGDTVRLFVARHATVLDLKGGVRLGGVAGSSLVGVSLARSEASDEANSFVVHGLLEEAGAVADVSISEVAVPVSLEGLATISTLRSDARYVSPLVHRGLPAMTRMGTVQSSDSRSDLLVQAEYARALARLGADKGAPASVRAALAWCRYRMRNRVAPGFGERVLLSGYRTLGYGERFVPPLLLFLALALLATVVSVASGGELSRMSLCAFGGAFLDWLVTPLHLLRLTQPTGAGAAFPQPWDTLARLLIAIPFVTTVLVIRKYVKEDEGS